ncbi:transcription termination factor Rho [Microgenomates group bacterium RBG_16_45_19]|nr:MAG: transcription termination factor Rho [Microgenomates group bacterium RBG_16_45_19]
MVRAKMSQASYSDLSPAPLPDEGYRPRPRVVNITKMRAAQRRGVTYDDRPMEHFDGQVDGRIIPDAGLPTETIKGMLDLRQDGSGVLRGDYRTNDKDAYISGSQVRRFRLRPGDLVEGPARRPKENERYWGLLRVDSINGKSVEEAAKRPDFTRLTPVYPNERLNLELGTEPMSNRIIDLVAPIGKGQRAMVVSPPKAGKTTVLKDIATGVAKNHPECHLMAVLIGERPEEVTDISRHIMAVTGSKGEVAASNFDEPPQDQTRIAELALERAKRLVEMGGEVVILMDSITRLARAYNLAIPTSGRTLSGGFDPAALYPPKRFFGAARNFEVGGSLTIVGTALVETGSRMDDLIYEEFKGTGNQELHLSRKLANRRVFPSIEVQKSGTRRDDLLFDSTTYQSIVLMHRMFDMLNEEERTEVLIERLRKTKSNKDFLATLKNG